MCHAGVYHVRTTPVKADPAVTLVFVALALANNSGWKPETAVWLAWTVSGPRHVSEHYYFSEVPFMVRI